MRLVPILLMALALPAAAQTADRSAAPPSGATAAPPAHTGSYAVQNGQLFVAPGLHIPNGNLPWALDTVDGKQVLVPIHGTLLSGSAAAATGTLDGAGSRTPLHSTSPVFFLHTSDRTENSGDSGRGSPTGWALLAVTVSANARSVSRPSFADVNKATVCAPPVLCTAAESLPDGWLRISTKDPLPPGEYALVPVPKNTPTSGNQLAYDFTVDGNKPAATDAVSPGQNLDTKRKNKR